MFNHGVSVYGSTTMNKLTQIDCKTDKKLESFLQKKLSVRHHRENKNYSATELHLYELAKQTIDQNNSRGKSHWLYKSHYFLE